MNDFELDNMRQQMAILKKKLQKEEIMNDQLMRKAIGTKLHRLKFDRWRKLLLILMGIVYVPWMLYDLVGAPLWFIVLSVLFFALAGFYDVYYTWDLTDGDLSDMRLLELQQKVARVKRMNARWLWIGIPFAVVWVCIFLWLIIVEQDSAMADGETTPIVIGALTGAVIGSMIGAIVYRRQQRRADELIDDIRELTATQ